MDWIQIIVLALVQGLTEFLPISSSAHLILVPVVLQWPDQGLAFDVAVHVGTLLAVVGYFRRDVWAMLRDGSASLIKRRHVGESRLAWAVLLGTLPVGIAALLFKDFIELQLRSPLVIATTSIIFGLLLGWADHYGQRRQRALDWRAVLIVALAQALALIPGTSRSGITMTAGLFLGLGREMAARFSFLLAIPVIFLAGLVQTLELVEASMPVDWGSLLAGVLLSAVSAYLCIHYFLKLIERIGMLPFVVYRVLLGAVLFMVFV